MEEAAVVLGLVLVLVVVGSICGIIAFVKQRKLWTRLNALEQELRHLYVREPAEEKPSAAPLEEEIVFELPADQELPLPPIETSIEDSDTLISPPEQEQLSL